MSSLQSTMTVMVLYPEREGNERIAFEKRSVPQPEKGEVLVRVRAAGIGGQDKRIFAAEELGWRTKRRRSERGVISGYEFSGIVATGGSRFNEGDEVYGYTNFRKGGVTHAEFVCVSERMISYKPERLTHVEAATVPTGCMTSLKALQELAGVTERQRVLLSGATGGVGIYAVQIAKMLGAHVTAQGRSWHEHELLRLGVDSFIEYTREEVLHSDELFDVIFDVAGIWNFDDMAPHLTSRGTFITTHPERDRFGIVSSYFTAKKSKYLFVAHGRSDVLENITALFDSELLEPIVGSVSPFYDALDEFDPEDRKIVGRRVLLIE